MEHLLTLEEVAQMFAISENEVLNLVERGIIPCYKVAGVYLRFKDDQIKEVKDKIFEAIARDKANLNESLDDRQTVKDMVLDFFHFYDYYMVMSGIIGFLIYLVLKT